MPWKPKATSQIEREVHALQMAVLNLRQQLSSKQTYAQGCRRWTALEIYKNFARHSGKLQKFCEWISRESTSASFGGHPRRIQ
jgi:hypothetical protein